eukprot:TRINITY_DN25387_c0_g1_i1.p1 TRINITY_DN25387_c0_g1~~TRINITY_DN25387_c0_g1_i1.p1  ORF type:complete len:248 (-),score=48.77 TRINITY_DN25387_c0_g1_i1:84-770(-)
MCIRDRYMGAPLNADADIFDDEHLYTQNAYKPSFYDFIKVKDMDYRGYLARENRDYELATFIPEKKENISLGKDSQARSEKTFRPFYEETELEQAYKNSLKRRTTSSTSAVRLNDYMNPYYEAMLGKQYQDKYKEYTDATNRPTNYVFLKPTVIPEDLIKKQRESSNSRSDLMARSPEASTEILRGTIPKGGRMPNFAEQSADTLRKDSERDTSLGSLRSGGRLKPKK